MVVSLSQTTLLRRLSLKQIILMVCLVWVSLPTEAQAQPIEASGRSLQANMTQTQPVDDHAVSGLPVVSPIATRSGDSLRYLSPDVNAQPGVRQPAAGQPLDRSEDEFIRQISGQTAVAKPVTVAAPNFEPPSPTAVLMQFTGSGIASPTVASPVPVNPVQVTMGTNSDVGLNLWSARSPVCNVAIGCYNPAPIVVGQQMPLLTNPYASVPLLVPSSPAPSGVKFTNPAGIFPPDGLPPSNLPPDNLLPNNPAGSLPLAPAGNLPLMPTQPQPTTALEPAVLPRSRPLIRSTALSPTAMQLQGVLLYQGDDFSARGRLSIVYPVTPQFLFGAAFDLTTGGGFTDSQRQGFSVNELYFVSSLGGLPNFRVVVGQIDLTSYFDRNSFAKDGATHFFNPVFQTNPALAATGISSRPGLLANWSLTDNIEAKAAIFSSSRALGNFSMDGFAGEIGLRYGNAIIRGTYVSDRDAGTNSGFQEIFSVSRGNGRTGLLRSDREEAFGINTEVFIPQIKMGLFARYGRYNNLDLGLSGETYSAGVSFLDLLTRDDRLGIAYGRGVSNDQLRRTDGARVPDVLEVFYDFRFLPNLRLGFTLQQRNDFSETVAGIRLKTEFDVTPAGRLVQ